MPVIVITYVPAGVECNVPMVKVELSPDPGVSPIIDGLRDSVREGDEAVTLRLTFPVSPWLARVTVTVAEFPATILDGTGCLAEIVKPD